MYLCLPCISDVKKIYKMDINTNKILKEGTYYHPNTSFDSNEQYHLTICNQCKHNNFVTRVRLDSINLCLTCVNNIIEK